MNLALDFAIILAVWRWADWKNWIKYHSSMLFAGAMALLYNVMALTHDYFLWKIVPSFFTYTIEEILHCFVLMPGTALLFLSRWTERKLINKITYCLKFILIYSIFELLLYRLGIIQYSNGWNYPFSIIFYTIMFPGLLLHYKKPGLGYLVFILTTVFGVYFFKIPL